MSNTHHNTLTQCNSCYKELTREEVKYSDSKVLEFRHCFECHIDIAIELLSEHLKEARITFEEMMRKLFDKVDK